MKFEVKVYIKVDPEANFLEVDDEEILRVIRELFVDMIYDIDDVKLVSCEVSNG